jgi:hypothetical protein
VRRPASTALFLALMFLGSLGLWVGVPLLWLFVAGRIQGATGSLGAAVGLAMLGVLVSIVAMVPLLRWLGERHAHARLARGLEDLGNAPLEGVIVVSAVVALAAFVVWFFFLSGAEPLPLGLPK